MDHKNKSKRLKIYTLFEIEDTDDVFMYKKKIKKITVKHFKDN